MRCPLEVLVTVGTQEGTHRAQIVVAAVQETMFIAGGTCFPTCGLSALQALVELGLCKQPFCYTIELVVVDSLKYW